jgi:hypothetical protein
MAARGGAPPRAIGTRITQIAQHLLPFVPHLTSLDRENSGQQNCTRQ